MEEREMIEVYCTCQLTDGTTWKGWTECEAPSKAPCTRGEAIQAVGLEAVETVEALDCECTSRATGGTDWEGWTEYASSLELADGRTLVAYYYQRDLDVQVTEDGAPDLGALEWTVDHYEVVG